MKANFIHCADVHLGYQQYGMAERFDDFGRAFLEVVDAAIQGKADFVLIAGDLFHKRTVEPMALSQAVTGLQRLRDSSIPAIAVEGNHERPHYSEHYGWLDFLDAQGLLCVLNPRIVDGTPVLERYQAGQGGAYIDVGNVRVYGIKYFGAVIGRVVEALPAALKGIDRKGVEYSILLLHAGVEGEMDYGAGALTQSQLEPLRPYFNFVGLGHLHKPFQREGWVFNPGSLETVSIEESRWPERGYYHVEVDTSQTKKHRAQLISNPRRDFKRLSLDVSRYKSPELVYDALNQLVRRQERAPEASPVVEIELRGTLGFDATSLDLEHIRQLLIKPFGALTVLLKNHMTFSEYEVAVPEEGEARPVLERRVLKELLERDERFRANAEDWAGVVAQLKQMALADTSPEGIVGYLQDLNLEW